MEEELRRTKDHPMQSGEDTSQSFHNLRELPKWMGGGLRSHTTICNIELYWYVDLSFFSRTPTPPSLSVAVHADVLIATISVAFQ